MIRSIEVTSTRWMKETKEQNARKNVDQKLQGMSKMEQAHCEQLQAVLCLGSQQHTE